MHQLWGDDKKPEANRWKSNRNFWLLAAKMPLFICWFFFARISDTKCKMTCRGIYLFSLSICMATKCEFLWFLLFIFIPRVSFIFPHSPATTSRRCSLRVFYLSFVERAETNAVPRFVEHTAYTSKWRKYCNNKWSWSWRCEAHVPANFFSLSVVATFQRFRWRANDKYILFIGKVRKSRPADLGLMRHTKSCSSIIPLCRRSNHQWERFCHHFFPFPWQTESEIQWKVKRWREQIFVWTD